MCYNDQKPNLPIYKTSLTSYKELITSYTNEKAIHITPEFILTRSLLFNIIMAVI